jgi:hypothetical protein
MDFMVAKANGDLKKNMSPLTTRLKPQALK